jgi:hypothetical protein
LSTRPIATDDANQITQQDAGGLLRGSTRGDPGRLSASDEIVPKCLINGILVVSPKTRMEISVETATEASRGHRFTGAW